MSLWGIARHATDPKGGGIMTEPIEDLVERLRLRLTRDPSQNLYVHRTTLEALLDAITPPSREYDPGAKGGEF